jgi:hypothetical protein
MSKPSSTNCSKAFNDTVLLFSFFQDVFILLTAFGNYRGGVHLLPFRTEKLSPLALMVLVFRESK